MSLIYDYPLMDKAIAFCWETQRMLARAKFEGWHPERSLMYMECQAQLWRRFPRGVRTEAHYKFMEQLNEQLGKPTGERDTDKPVWFNEQLGWTATGRPGASDTGAAIIPATK